MALYPNGRYMTRSPGRHFGAAPGLDVLARGRGDRLNRFVGSEYTPTASTPDGYGLVAIVPPIVAGSMSAQRRVVDVSGSGNLLRGGPMEGSAAMLTLSPSGALSLVVSLAANVALLTVSGDGAVLSLTVSLDGSGSVSFTGAGGLSMIVPFAGTGSVAHLSGTSDLRGLLSLEGEWTPFSELSPQNLAAAVWNTIASQYDDAGSMGAKLNAAGSGGVDLNALAEAVWEYASRQLSTAPPTASQVADAVWAKTLP